jgi:hypothetical protein
MSSVRAALIATLLPCAVFGLVVACSSGSGSSVIAGNDGATHDGAGSDGAAADDTGNPPTPDGATDSADDPIAMMDSPVGPPPYPAGPYGINVGDVLQNLSWDGYVNTTGAVVSTSLPYGPTSLQDLRGNGHGYALVHLSDFY